MHVALAFLGVRWEAWGLSRWLHLIPHAVQMAHAVLGAGFARALSNRVVKRWQGAAHLPACAVPCACRTLTAGPVRWGTEGKACSYTRVSTGPESNLDITDVSEMGVKSTLIVWWGLDSPGLSFPIQQQHSLVSPVSVTALSHTRCLSQLQGDYLDSISVHWTLRETIWLLLTCPEGKIYSGMSQTHPVCSHYVRCPSCYTRHHAFIGDILHLCN